MMSFMIGTRHQMLLGNQNKRMRWAEHAARVGQKINAYRGLVCKTEGGREVNIKMDFHKIHLGGKGVG
jgi:hypothetical protein